MAIVTLPLRSDLSAYSFQVELDAKSYGFVFRWNEREGAWYFDIYDGEGELLRAGMKVVIDFPLIVRATSKDLPPGKLFAVDTSGALDAPGLEDLGARVQVVYYEASEL